MYKEIAFDPACLANIEYYNLVKQHFGFDKGRYISAEMKAWAREAMGHVKESNLKPVRMKSVKNYLNKLGRSKTSEEFLLTRDRQDVTSACWQDWVEKQQDIRRFSCVVADAVGDDRIDIDQINDGCARWSVPPSISVRRDPASIIEALGPLIVLSGHLTIIDQFCRFSENKVLEALFIRLANTAVGSLRIVTAMATKDIQTVYDRTYRPLNKAQVQFEWISAPEKFFHDRYLISDVGAIRSGQGFGADVAKGAHSDLANINIIGREEADRTLNDLSRILHDGAANVELRVSR